MVDAHFGEHEERLNREIAEAVQRSDSAPASSEAGKLAADQIRISFTRHDAHKTRVLRDVSNTYTQMLEESKRQAKTALDMQKDFSERQLAIQQQALDCMKETSSAIMRLVDQQSLF